VTRVVEIRAYNLAPGTRDAFHRAVGDKAMPMLARWGMDVVAYGPSPHDVDSYYLIRSFSSLAAMQEEEDAFYGSDEWRSGPRETIVSKIESMTSIVLELEEQAIDSMRTPPAPT
jgi:NIPSNAP